MLMLDQVTCIILQSIFPPSSKQHGENRTSSFGGN